jgi:SecD/SecF fusion protein
VIAEDRVIAQLAEANPRPAASAPTAQDRAEADRILRRVLNDATAAPPRRRRPRLGILVPITSLLVVVGVAALIVRTGGSSTRGSSSEGRLQITLAVQPTAQTPRITASAMSREIAIMRRRLTSLGDGYTVAQSGAHGIIVALPKGGASPSRVSRLVTQPARLRFYDWEADVLTPNGKTAASQLAAQDPTAVLVSQGGNEGAGAAGPGSMSLYDAVTLAAEQPRASVSRFLSRLGPEYYMFGASGSSACAAAARDWGASTTPAGRCLLAGPVSAASRRDAMGELAAQVPPGVTASEGQVRVIPQGVVILQATRLNAAAQVPIFSPRARFFVLRDHLALTGDDITHPRASTEQTGQPDVTFGFTGTGQTAFQRATQAIAARGRTVSVAGATFDQHFAVALDNQLLTVPQIDFRTYPDGIIGGRGADITGGFTRRAARDVATELRSGALPLAVRVVR